MRTTACLLCLLLAGLATAADETKLTALTPKEAADGRLLLFDGESPFGWASDGGDLKVEKGQLVIGGTKATTAFPTTRIGSGELVLEYAVEGNPAELLIAYPDPSGPSNSTTLVGLPGSVAQLKINVVAGERRMSSELKVKAGSEEVSRYEGKVESTASPYLKLQSRDGGRVLVRSLKFRPTGARPLFNGKDLTGWKVFPDRKSKFTVTPEGWLNIKDGPGDLQTEGQWADFVLQLECISNGPHLNSGVFFRARPGEYQQGYEAQIRNQFTDEPKQEYTVEVHDPVTHELKEKTKVKSAAVDYGTGAIYRRVPARRGVAKDGEWFTLTVIAQGRHLATWVNGIQVVDWTDNRPLKDNGRNGCRLEKGVISFQGHDPTTDLSFRNIRLQELPSANP